MAFDPDIDTAEEMCNLGVQCPSSSHSHAARTYADRASLLGDDADERLSLAKGARRTNLSAAKARFKAAAKNLRAGKITEARRQIELGRNASRNAGLLKQARWADDLDAELASLDQDLLSDKGALRELEDDY